ncbi:MAG: 50S ribosomal protein L6 [Gammaproteobacteria bacterium 39-13]|nr:50S ribosomal protein L6 [Gammaproteobacteria bacterium]OJV92083.1 MAG: 50S ribosomal protein L6 [Gammaproteobacteria bacterium 39-13]
MSSRVARKPIEIPSGVGVNIKDGVVAIKGAKGELAHELHQSVSVKFEDQQILVAANKDFADADAIAGTTRAILNNNVKGVSEGFSKKLQLVGVGYRAQVAKGKDGRTVLNLTLGLSHPVVFIAPIGVELTSATVTEIEVTGVDKQLVGQAAADIRGICKGLRKPEPYKGKGIRYADEVIVLKETKKK